MNKNPRETITTITTNDYPHDIFAVQLALSISNIDISFLFLFVFVSFVLIFVLFCFVFVLLCSALPCSAPLCSALLCYIDTERLTGYRKIHRTTSQKNIVQIQPSFRHGPADELGRGADACLRLRLRLHCTCVCVCACSSF